MGQLLSTCKSGFRFASLPFDVFEIIIEEFRFVDLPYFMQSSKAINVSSISNALRMLVCYETDEIMGSIERGPDFRSHRPTLQHGTSSSVMGILVQCSPSPQNLPYASLLARINPTLELSD